VEVERSDVIRSRRRTITNWLLNLQEEMKSRDSKIAGRFFIKKRIARLRQRR
jgi:hypothetical protein